MPAYNRENIIKEAINSVLGQTYEDIELIVVDDGSTDQTSKVVREIEDPRLKYFYQENAGACAARNNEPPPYEKHTIRRCIFQPDKTIAVGAEH